MYSYTQLRMYSENPYQYYSLYVTKESIKKPDNTGIASHIALLEPEKFENKVAQVNNRSKVDKEKRQELEAQGVICLSEAEHSTVMQHKAIGERYIEIQDYISSFKQKEVHMENELFLGRLDLVNENRICDVKFLPPSQFKIHRYAIQIYIYNILKFGEWKNFEFLLVSTQGCKIVTVTDTYWFNLGKELTEKAIQGIEMQEFFNVESEII